MPISSPWSPLLVSQCPLPIPNTLPLVTQCHLCHPDVSLVPTTIDAPLLTQPLWSSPQGPLNTLNAVLLPSKQSRCSQCSFLVHTSRWSLSATTNSFIITGVPTKAFYHWQYDGESSMDLSLCLPLTIHIYLHGACLALTAFTPCPLPFPDLHRPLMHTSQVLHWSTHAPHVQGCWGYKRAKTG